MFDVNRYLAPYLASDLSIAQRRDLVLSNQNFSYRLFGSAGLRVLCQTFELWSTPEYTIDLRIDPVLSNEGDFVLVFSAKGERLQWLRFTFVDAATLGFDPGSALFVSLIQGRPHSAETMRLAATACGGVRPAYLLFAALTGIADRAEVRSIIGVSNSRLLSYDEKAIRNQGFDYDTFWMERNGCAGAGGLYRLDLDTRDIARDARATSHRRRAAKRRLVREAVRRDVAARIEPILVTGQTASAGARAGWSLTDQLGGGSL